MRGDHNHWLRACAGKHRYKSARVAWKVVKRNRGNMLSAYRCDFCGAWHIGHHPKRPDHRRPQ